MRLTDFHMHSNFSPDSPMPRAEAVEAAIRAGLTDLCFTEHMELGHEEDCFNHQPDWEGMARSLEALQTAHPSLLFYRGLEAGYMPETARQTADVLSQHLLDYVILSTHCMNGHDCYNPESCRGLDKTAAYRMYLEAVYASVCDGLMRDHYDCVGHIGFIAKCRHYENNTLDYSMAPKLIDAILTRVIRDGKGIEVNTSGLRKIGHLLPHPSIIARYRELGGQIITLGSDSHLPNQVGADIKQAMQTVRECGFDRIAIFERHKPVFLPLV